MTATDKVDAAGDVRRIDRLCTTYAVEKRCHAPGLLPSSGSGGEKNSGGNVNARLHRPRAQIPTIAATISMTQVPFGFLPTLLLAHDGDMTGRAPRRRRLSSTAKMARVL